MKRNPFYALTLTLFLWAALLGGPTSSFAADLTLTIPETAVEGSGVLSGAGTVSLSEAAASDLTVSLSSSDTSKVEVPETVTVSAGESSATFDLLIMDDLNLDGPQIVTITASAQGWTTGIAVILLFHDIGSAGFSTAIAAGSSHSLALNEQGFLWTWGSNWNGELGDGTNESRNTPVPVSSLNDVFAVSGGGSHTLALDADGLVWAWGANYYGQLGNGRFNYGYYGGYGESTPVRVFDFVDAVAIAAGADHSLALKNDGTVWAWGANYSGQLGNGGTTPPYPGDGVNIPGKVNGVSEIIAIAAGDYHSLAVKMDGTVWAWGSNNYGKLGDGTYDYKNAATQVSAISQVIKVAGGSDYSLALKSDGTVWAWGYNNFGQLGDGTFDYFGKNTPVQVSQLQDVIAIASGSSHSLALKSDGTVWAWGYNNFGQLGDGTNTQKNTPVQVAGLSGITSVAAGYSYSLALKSDGTVWAWGANWDGQLGNGEFDSETVPTQVLGSEEEFLQLISLVILVPESIVEGAGLLSAAGSIQVKKPPLSDLEVTLLSSHPGDIFVPATVTIPAGNTFAVFDLTVGDDSLLNGPRSVRISASAPGFSSATAFIEFHDDETAALSLEIPSSASESDSQEPLQGTISLSAPPDGDITVYLGSSDTSTVLVPATVLIAAGLTSAVFPISILDNWVIDGPRTITIEASVSGWNPAMSTIVVEDDEPMVLTVEIPQSAGERAGVLTGAGKVSTQFPVAYDLLVNLSSDDPSEVAVPSFVVIPAGHAIAPFDLTILDDGEIDGTQVVKITASSPGWTPGSSFIAVMDNDHYTPRVSVACGGNHSLAADDGGVLWAWGYNYYGQLGDGTLYTTSYTPIRVHNLFNIIAAAGGSAHSLALREDGTVWAWGYNSAGQLGDTTLDTRTNPVKVYGLSGVIAVAAGSSHSLALKSDDTVWAWGSNGSGQLGDGLSGSSRNYPVKAQGLADVVAIAGGGSHSLALKSDGTVWAWGYNYNGQLGDTTFDTRTNPVKVYGLSGVIAVAAGGSHSLALKSDGTVWAWGSSSYGQLGTGSTSWRNTIPARIDDFMDVLVLSAGGSHSLALMSDGTVWSWGYNSSGQLGDGTSTQKNTPVQVASLSGMIAVAAGSSHSLALKSDGSLWAWGYNYYGQLGDGTNENQPFPVPVGESGNPLGLISLQLRIPHSVTEGDGLLADHGLVSVIPAPSFDLVIHLTSDDPTEITVPAAVIIPSGQTSVTFDLMVEDDNILDGSQTVEITASAPGYVPVSATIMVHDNEEAILTLEIPSAATEGDGLLSGRGTVMVDQAPDRDVIVFLLSDREIEVWVPAFVLIPAGMNEATFDLVILDDDEVDGTVPVTITASVAGWISGSAVIEVADNETRNLFLSIPERAGERAGILRNAGFVFLSGYFAEDLVIHLSSDDTTEVRVPSTVIIPAGQIGISFDITIIDDDEIDGTQVVTITASAPGWTSVSKTIEVLDNDGDGGAPLPAVAAGRLHSPALKDDGTVWAWGYNYYGQLGDGSSTQMSTPVQVVGLEEVIAVSAGEYHSLALKSDGTVWAWGRNNSGQLGDGTYNERRAPVQVLDLFDVIAISAGAAHSLAVKSDGTAWAWGHGGSGRLGNNSSTTRTRPVRVSTITNAVKVSAGRLHSLALISDGKVWAWGSNSSGRLGIGSTISMRSTPTLISDLTGVTYISAGDSHSLAVKSDGTAWAWGNGGNGRLGDGFTSTSYSPVQVVTLGNATEVAAGGAHSLALTSDGTAWAWGYNYYGQLGDGTATQRITPVQVSGLFDAVAVAAGLHHSLALKSDGTLRAWGYNYYGQLGDGTNEQQNTPTSILDSGDTGIFRATALFLTLPESVTEGDGLLSGVGVVHIEPAPTMDVIVILSSSDESELVPSSFVTVPAGQTSAVFDLTVIDDDLLDGSQVVIITASAIGYAPSSAKILVHDNEAAVLFLEIPSSATEGDGLLSSQGIVTLSAPADEVVVVFLASSNASDVMVPAFVIIPAGENSASFDLTVLDNMYIDDARIVTITAYVTGWPLAIAEILVMDDENRNLMLTLPESVTEGEGMRYSAGRVSLSGPFSSDLIVALSSDDTSEIAVPSSVTISAGATSATFNIMVLDDDEIDGTQTVTVTASAEGWVSGSATILVHDNDPGSLRLSSSTYSVDETGGSALITVNRVTSTSGEISVDYATSDGTATAGADYIETSGTLVFAHGESQKTFSIPILDDLEPEGNETVIITLSNPGGGASLSSPTTAVLTIVDDDYYTIPYSQDFSGGLTAHGWTYYTYYGRNQVVNGRLRMDGTSSSYYGSNEAVLTINLEGRTNVLLSFFQAEFNDETHSLPAAFSGRHNGDGVSISMDGNTWYTIVNASELAVGSLGRAYSVNLDEHAARIRLNYDASFAYTRAFKIKFQRYGVGSYSNAGREWDDIVLDRASEPPYIPSDPVPGHEAQGIPILADQGHAVALAWTGGDPDPDDAVTYDLLLGTAPDSLASAAINLVTPTFTKQNLAQGTTYYWRVIAQDNHGNITTGPVWQFTTWQPDLVVSALTLDPEAGIVAGTEVTISATVTNNGPAPVLTSFQVDLRVNGESLGAGSVSAPLESGATAVVSRTWTALAGDFTIEAVADSTGVVGESNEENNTASLNLTAIPDTTPPELVSTEPEDGALLRQVERIVITLFDRYGTVDHQAMVSGNIVVSKDGTPVPGIVTENNDQFTFTPDSSPLPDGLYQVAVTAQDLAGNTQIYTFSFTVDGLPPEPPVITGGTVYTGLIQARPAANGSNTAVVTLTGARSEAARVWVTGVKRVDEGEGDWSLDVTLAQGDNALEVWLVDRAGNRGSSTWVDIQLDTVAPSVVSVTPTNGAFINVSPPAVTVLYLEATSGLNLGKTLRSLRDGNGQEILGTWSLSGEDSLVFIPGAPLLDGPYTVQVQLEDNMGNRSGFVTYGFTLDTTPPPAPHINPVTSPTHRATQTIYGAKEAYAKILLNGVEVVGHTSATVWEYVVTLESGLNTLTFVAVDRAGNQSSGVTVEIVYDDTPPPAVTNLKADGKGVGAEVKLGWAGYNEAEHGDIDFYRIYMSPSAFSDVTTMTPIATVGAGTFAYTVTGLTKGTTYWFAVVAVDLMGNALSAVTPVSAVPTDTIPPHNVTNLQVTCYENRLVFSWTVAADPDGDLAGYRVYFNNAPDGLSLNPDVTSHEQTGLSPATAYPFKITSYDQDGNESSGAEIIGITLLANPTGLTAKGENGYADLAWDSVSPAQLVKHYAVYVSTTDFTSVEAMSPTLTTSSTSAKAAGLANNTDYFFAVTAVNLAGGEQKAVTTVSATPVPDSRGPEITNVRVNGEPLVDGYVFTRISLVTLNATDPSGASRVEFYVDGTLVSTDYSGPSYDFTWNIYAVEDGAYTLVIKAYDTLGNMETLEYTVTVALAKPQSPMITFPSTGTVTNKPLITVSGAAEKNSEVVLLLGGSDAAGPTAVSQAATFAIPLALAEGQNHITAEAQNRAGRSAPSSEVIVTLDTSIPPSPTGLMAESRAGGVVRLSWQAPSEVSIKGYNLYRASNSFTDKAQAVKVNANLIQATLFEDLPLLDGTYHYRATAVSSADNESGLSEEVSARSDRTPPRLALVEYAPSGKYDPASGIFGRGRVDVLLHVSEPLQALPFFSITPLGGIPFSVDLRKVSDTEYEGFFVIDPSTPSGTAYAVFSGRDLAGNRGTEIDEGESLVLDTEGPGVITVTLQPQDPIRNDAQNPVTVTVRIGLNDFMKPGETPLLSYLLSGPGRTASAVEALSQVSPREGEAQAWQGFFTLPADGGEQGPESLSFQYLGVDYLDNESGRFLCPNLFQVYQGDLPPLEAPSGLTGKSLPQGRIELQWQGVEGAAGYQIFRKGPGEQGELALYGDPVTATGLVDEPAEEGAYTYAVASIREDRGEESLSGMSNSVTVVSDATPPGAPQSLVLTLVPQGIKAQWEAPPFTEPVTYTIYRAPVSEITSVEGLTPLAKGITQTMVIDPKPSPSDHCYVVSAVDASGNESEPSNSYYLNFRLLPVATLKVVQQDTAPPVVSWTYPPADIAGYDIYLGEDESRIKLNSRLLTGLSYIDTGYNNDARRYTVVAVDNQGYESPGRSLTLPAVEALVTEGSRIKRGIMNRLEYEVDNFTYHPVDALRLKVRVGNKDHYSSPFALPPATSNLQPATTVIPVVVGGYGDLPPFASLITTIEHTPHEGEKAEIIRSSGISVVDGMLVLQIENEEFVRGGTGKVRFTLENTGEEEIEITLARNNGKSASNEVTLYLLDPDENVLSTLNFKQNLGDGVVTLPNGNSVARIPPGALFSSHTMGLPVPAGAPDDVSVLLAIESIYYHQGKPDQVKMTGLSATRRVTMRDTSYYGEVLTIEPRQSAGDEDVVIAGRAVERATQLPMANVPLKLVISVGGFERVNQVYTDVMGSFDYAFTPLANESGLYKVWAVHPDLMDRPVQGQFVISRVSVSPASINLSVPRNYERTINIQVSPTEGTEVRNLHLLFAEEDQPEGVYPQGIHLTTGSPIALLGSKQKANLPFTLWADNTADATGRIVLKVTSDEGTWGSVIVNTHFSQALPVLAFTPSHVETGVAYGGTINETVTLTNKGLADMTGIQLSLVKPDGAPAPGWVHLNSPSNLGTLAVGQSRQVTIGFSPTSAQASQGVHYFKLRIKSDNYSQTDINLYASVTESGVGNALFKVSDIYTGTLNDAEQLIQGLAGARVHIQNEEVLTVERTLTTDNLGEAYFTDVPAGRYKYRVTANKHQESIGRLWIKPGITVNEDVFLDYTLVTVEWKVTEITIEDRYDIVLTAVYETNVPAAVVVAEPASIRLPVMRTGDVYTGEFTLTNHGLIRADNVTFTLPGDDQYFKYELLGGLPKTIEAKSKITVPYRVICLQSLSAGEQDGTGGGCQRFHKCITTGYEYQCANGKWAKGTARHCMFYDNGECTVASSPATGGIAWTIGDGLGGGSYSSVAPAPRQISGVKCFPAPVRKESDCDPCGRLKETRQDLVLPVRSSVHLVNREYMDEKVDLFVKVPGGRVEIKRLYYGDQWHWEHTRNNLKFEKDSSGLHILSLDKGGVIYKRAMTLSNIYGHDTYRISRLETGFRWEDKRGNWIDYDESGRMTSYGSRSGVTGTYLYDEGGKCTGIADRTGAQVIWFDYQGDLLSAAYDAANRWVEYGYAGGKLESVTDLLGYTTYYQYDSSARLTKVTDGAGRETRLSHDQYGSVVSVLDSENKGYRFEFDYDEARSESYARVTFPGGMIKEIWYDREGETRRVDVNGRNVKKIVKDGRNLIITDDRGNETRQEYDEWDNLIRQFHPDGSGLFYEYERRFNKRTREVNERNITTRYTYDDAGNLVSKTEALGTESERTTEYTYDRDGNQVTLKVLGDENTLEALTVMAYDDYGNMASISDPEGNTTHFTHDIMGNVLTKADAGGKTWSYTYDAAGRLEKVSDPLGNNTGISYDAVGNKIREIDAEENETWYEYDDWGNLTKRIDALGNAVLFAYNADGKLIRQTDQEGKASYYDYDNEGRLLKVIDGNGNEIRLEYHEIQGQTCTSCGDSGTQANPSVIFYPTFRKEFKYDVRGRKVEEKDIFGLSLDQEYTTSYAYDAAGNVRWVRDKEEKTTWYEYDALNRLEKVTDPLGNDTQYFSDARDNLIALQDAKGNVTHFDYDANNRLVREIRPMGQQTSYGYDGVGNLAEKVDAKGQRTAYLYDDAGRLVEISYYDPADPVNPVKTVSFSYDRVGNLKAYDDAVTAGAYDYDALYRKIFETVDYGPFDLSYSYDYYKNGLKKTFTGPDGVTYTYTYDANNQLTGIQIPGTGTITYNAYRWNRPLAITLPGGSKKEYDYDPLMRVKQITTRDPGQNILLNYNYSYDRMDNIQTKATEHGLYDYAYDDLYRLTTVENPTLPAESYAYDPVGNRLTSADHAEWTYNPNNELQSYDGVSFQYDLNGNTVWKIYGHQLTNYIYNVEDRLTKVEDSSGNLIAEYYYDPFGRRLWKDVDGTRTYFMYADEGLIGEYDSLGTQTTAYGYVPNSTWTTNPLFMKQGSQYYFYHNDHLGTPQKMTSSSGAVVWNTKYESFGKAVIDTPSTIENNLRFPGQYYDSETGLHYNYFRYFNRETGRYLNPDPVYFFSRLSDIPDFLLAVLMLPNRLSLYNYANMNPPNITDSYGLFGVDIVPSPGAMRCMEKVAEYWIPQLINKHAEYKDCKERCELLRKHAQCTDAWIVDYHVYGCKVGCFTIYQRDVWPIQFKMFFRTQMCFLMYQYGEKEKHYRDTEPVPLKPQSPF